jgi:hypothetical protein
MMLKEEKLTKEVTLRYILHLHNFIFLVFSYCTKVIHNESNCSDPENEYFLDFIYYGNLILYGALILLMVYYKYIKYEKMLNNLY